MCDVPGLRQVCDVPGLVDSEVVSSQSLCGQRQVQVCDVPSGV